MGFDWNVQFLGVRKGNLSWDAKLVSDDSENGNKRYFDITFMTTDMLYFPIQPTRTASRELNLTGSNGDDLHQFRTSEWEDYVTEDWTGVYHKVLLPWQTDYNAAYGDYYQKLSEVRASGLSVMTF